MGKIDQFTVEVEKPVYKVGETVAGNVFLKVKESQSLNFIKLVAMGHASAEWYDFVIFKFI
jgi:hypothetical protein